MTAGLWVRRARRRLGVLAAVRAVAWAGAVLLAGLALGAFIAGPELGLAARLAGLGTLIVLLWRERFVWSLSRVALWLEERIPELRYALVTAIDPRYAARLGPWVEPLLGRLDADRLMRRAAARSVLPAACALALAALAFATVPAGSFVWDPGATAPGFAGDTRPSRLAPLRGTITPPRYALEAGVEPQAIEEPTTIGGLAGSNVEITGPGEPDGLDVRLGDSALTAAAAGEVGEGGEGGAAGDRPGAGDRAGAGGPAGRARWRVAFTLPDSASALRLEDREHRRLIVLAPIRDRPPVVQLILPARDTTVREPTGTLVLDARLADDIALATARFEYIVSSGESEGNFSFREGVVGARRIDEAGVRDTRLRVRVPLGHFELKPGDQLSVRAVALDDNDWSGPGVGYSEPRTLRVARPGEYDSLAVEPAPPAVDSTLMTLRWLIELVERLEASREDLPREVFVDSSRGFGARAERLRLRVQQLQADHTLGGMFPPNPLLATAYRALIEGEYALKVAEPGESLPHLWDALHALQQYAWAERYYLRGRGPEVLVDLARVRLAGTDTGYARPRTPRGLADTTRVRWRGAYVAALERLDAAPEDARERLALLQVEALRTEPALADALGAAVAALQAGRDPAPALERARRILDGPTVATDSLPRWSGAW